MMEILVPTATAQVAQKMKAAADAQLSGKRVAIVSNGWRSMEVMTPRLDLLLRERYDASAIRRYSVHLNRPISQEILDSIRKDCDAAIVGIAN
jgi:hypothetical protein